MGNKVTAFCLMMPHRRNELILEKPPIVEVWVGFTFNPSPTKKEWNLDVAMPFISRYKDEFKHVQLVRAEEIRIEERTPSGIPKKISGKARLDRVQARTDDGSRWLQVAEDVLIFNLVRRSSSYGGYAQLRDKSLGFLRDYIQAYHPDGVNEVALHYVNIIEIKHDMSGDLDLEDYFAFFKFPNPSRMPIERVSITLGFASSDARPRVTLRFRNEPSATQVESRVRFRLELHSQEGNLQTLEASEIQIALDRLHTELQDRFASSFTHKGLSLFEPKG